MIRTPSVSIDHQVNAVRLQVMTNAIYSIADEVVAALVRTSYSTNIKDRRDCSGAIFTLQGDLVAQGEVGTPLHLGVMQPAVLTALQAIPPESLEPGDDIILNMPYPEGPGHLNDVTVVSPVFYDERLVAFVANMSHHVDVGGFAPGSMAFGVWEHYQEGLQIPPLKISRRGILDQDLIRLITANLRTPSEFRGDLAAQIAANNVGERRLQDLMKKYGVEEVLSYMASIMDYSERRLRAAIGTLSEGSFSFEDCLEGDGLSDGDVTIRCTVQVREGTIRCDFRESDPQVLGPLNCRPPSVRACVYYVAKALLDPGLPPNSGAFRPLQVLTQPGTLLEVNYPGAVCNANIITTQRIVDVLLGAFYQLIPDRVCAACSGTMNLLNIGGRHSLSGGLFNYIETYGGGQGALPNRDGTSAVQNHMTNTRNAPVEVIESTYPLLIRGYGLVPESAGSGKFRGGFGMRREFEFLSDRVTVTLSSDRFRRGPWGLAGGGPAQPGACLVVSPDGKERNLPSKVTTVLGKGDCLISTTPGGGGRGNPLDRSAERVREDVLEGLLSSETALAVYGVVLRADLTLDWTATEHHRSALNARQVSTLLPA
ncbi:MAG: hydantoinase B/oxoprolinase family protein [Acidobacteriota bacterium]